MGHLSRLIRFDIHSLKKAHHPAHLKTAGSWKSLLQNAHFSQLYGSSVACCQNPWDNVFTPRREGNSEKRKSQRIVTHQFCSRRILQNNCVLWNWPAVSLKEANIKLQLCRARGTWFSCTYKINFSKLHFRVHTMQPSPFPFLTRSLVHIKLTRLPQTSVAFGNWSGSKWALPWNLLLATKGPNSHLVGTFVKIKIEKHCFLSTVGINFTQISFLCL